MAARCGAKSGVRFLERFRQGYLLPAMTGNFSTMKVNVVLVPFPLDDLTTTKVRPVVCLTDHVEWHPLMTLSTTIIVRELGALPVATHQHVIIASHRLFTIS